eukprot:CAMPEP_0116899876 /NCGR_PEP_ID=MMETSP0467-20121206/8350_1 /TAXON_ID=283647 /ORGANISM="Mesodinium pulex, Strain SPMC105" /LENGTH=59 /DNA_ID=CAMNT_0004572945 /DNA_START=356 /DNA_END=535 /DNA_ORIENTATION=+
MNGTNNDALFSEGDSTVDYPSNPLKTSFDNNRLEQQPISHILSQANRYNPREYDEDNID